MSNRRQYTPRRNRRGATIVLAVVMMVVLISMVAFAVDVGRMYLVRAQLQTAVDAGTVAAGLKLSQDSNDVAGAEAAARQFVQLNNVGWLVTVPDSAITIESGSWNAITQTFDGASVDPDAVRVSARQDGEGLLFAGVLGHYTFDVPRSAIATAGDREMDAILVLDLSGSMGAQGRIAALQDAAPEFVNVIEDVGDNDRIGVFGYGAIAGVYDPVAAGHSGVAYIDAPATLYPSNSDWVAVLEAGITSDFNYLRSSVLNSATLISNKYNGWTPIGAAIRDSAHYLNINARSGVQKILVLMSDGHANKPNGNGPGYALTMANHANSLDIKVYTISLGNAADEQLMLDIADATGAEYFDASGSGQTQLTSNLKEAFRRVAGAVKRVELVK